MSDLVVFTDQDGTLIVGIPAPGVTAQEVLDRDVPVDAISPRVISRDKLPSDKLFRDAWDDSNPEDFVSVNLDKAKLVTHSYRRKSREREFKPFDEIVQRGLPGGTAAELERVKIRKKYARIQSDIDSSLSEADLRTIIKSNNLDT